VLVAYIVVLMTHDLTNISLIKSLCFLVTSFCYSQYERRYRIFYSEVKWRCMFYISPSGLYKIRTFIVVWFLCCVLAMDKAWLNEWNA